MGTTPRTYDANGNTTRIGLTTSNPNYFSYDDRNRLRDFTINTTLFSSSRYNGVGERVLRLATTTANGRQYVYDQAGHLLGEYNLSGVMMKEYVWMDDTVVAVLSAFDGTTYQYVETDHLGSARAVVQPVKNQIIWRWDVNNTAFGSHTPNNNPDGDSLTYQLNLRYPGQYFDTSGLDYNFFRDYDPTTGRYVESDPIGLGGGVSTYGYVEGNPLGGIDPYGLRDIFVAVWDLHAGSPFSVGHVFVGEMNGRALLSEFPENHSHHGVRHTLSWDETLADEGRDPSAMYKISVPDDRAFDASVRAIRAKKSWDWKPSDDETNCTVAAYSAINDGGFHIPEPWSSPRILPWMPDDFHNMMTIMLRQKTTGLTKLTSIPWGK